MATLRNPPTRGEEVRTIRDRLKMTQEALARALGVSLVTVQNWESGRTARIPGMVRMALKELVRASKAAPALTRN